MKVVKKKHPGRVIFNILFWLVFLCVGVVILNTVIDQKNQYRYPLFGYRMTVIVTPSMATVDPSNESYITPEMKRVHVYDTITTKVYNSYNDIKLYDIATYYKDGVLICHRVIDKYENAQGKFLVFRGDANNASDAPVNYNQVRGKVITITPNIGRFILFTQSTWGKITIIGAFALVYITSLFLGTKKEK